MGKTAELEKLLQIVQHHNLLCGTCVVGRSILCSQNHLLCIVQCAVCSVQCAQAELSTKSRWCHQHVLRCSTLITNIFIFSFHRKQLQLVPLLCYTPSSRTAETKTAPKHILPTALKFLVCQNNNKKITTPKNSHNSIKGTNRNNNGNNNNNKDLFSQSFRLLCSSWTLHSQHHHVHSF